MFLDRKVLAVDLPTLVGLERAGRPTRLPAVLSWQELQALLDRSFAPHPLEVDTDTDLRTLQTLHGHQHRSTATSDTPIVDRSPFDR